MCNGVPGASVCNASQTVIDSARQRWTEEVGGRPRQQAFACGVGLHLAPAAKGCVSLLASH
jgi:hypothetical protein